MVGKSIVSYKEPKKCQHWSKASREQLYVTQAVRRNMRGAAIAIGITTQ